MKIMIGKSWARLWLPMWPGWLGLILVAAQAADAPRVAVKTVSTNQVHITVTNGVSGEIYGLYRRTLLQSPYSWKLHTIGTSGQTNFVVDRSIDFVGFFQVITGDDWDGDGVTNAADAGLGDTNIGRLTITIQGPAEGSTIH